MSVVDEKLVAAYVAASKGSKERAFLLALSAGFSFDRVVCAMNGGLAVVYACILRGWVSRGELTDLGRAEIAEGTQR
jgi:hypothetical protein